MSQMKMNLWLIWVYLIMQEYWKLNIIDSVSGNDPKSLLLQLMQDNAKNIGIFLSYYFKKQGAVVENVIVQGDPFFREENSGSIRVAFDLIFYNACLNIHEKEKDQMELDFDLQIPKSQIILRGPYWPEREMDEI